MAKSKAAAPAEDTRPFVVLREIKHDGKRYKEGDTIDLTYDEWVAMFGDGRVSKDECADQQEDDKKPGDAGGEGDGAGGEQGGAGGEGSQDNGGQQ